MRAYHLTLVAGLLAGCERPMPEPAPLLPRGPSGLLRFAEDAPPATGLSDPRLRRPPMNLRAGDDLDAATRAFLGERGWAKVPQMPAPPTELDEIANTITDADFNPDLGERITRLLDEKPAELVEAYGLSAVTYDEQFTEGYCEYPEVLWEFEEDGDDWEAAAMVGSYIEFVGDLEPVWTELGAACSAGLLANGGDIEGAYETGDCLEWEVVSFFGAPDAETGCRACVEDSGDFAACVAANTCDDVVIEQTWVEVEGVKVWYDLMLGYMLACAPDLLAVTYVLGDVADNGTLPQAFDHEAWAYLCVPFYDPAIEEVSYLCASGDGGPKEGDTLGHGIEAGYVNYVRQIGNDALAWHGRSYYADAVVLKNHTRLEWFWAWNPGTGAVSAPSWFPDSNGSGVADLGDENFGYTYGGWGLDPYGTRPDGQWMARDWIAMTTMKGSTTRNGIHIVGANFSRCAEDGWVGPDAEGRFACVDPLPPTGGWLNDGASFSTDSDYVQFYPFPVMTLASTGLPDPDVPGGVVIDVAGSTRLADPDWDACEWPHQFVPDRIVYPDVPDGWDVAGGSLWGDTYRFGKDDVRVALSTNVARDYCPAGADGEGWRTFENYVPEEGD